MLKMAVENAVKAGALPAAELPAFVVEVPGDATHGDLAANLAMVSAKTFGMPPRKIAEIIVENMPDNTNSIFKAAEIAGPGFINLFLSDSYFGSVVMAACLTGQNYGRTKVGNGEKVNVEFVSANPTGPMHLGNARGGALGDCLAEALSWAGYDVTREFYINDAGNQVVKFGKSLAARYLQIILGEEAVEFPEDGYQGEDIKERAQEFYALHGDAYAKAEPEALEGALIDYALPKNIQGLKEDLATYRVHYDVWFHESTLHESGAIEDAIAELDKRGAIYKQDGAVWYKATNFGGEKDEVLVRANGIPTYFAADIAYHANKFARGFTKAIDVWGADHHGHVARMKGALDAIGLDGNKLDIVLMQFVQLVRDGAPVRMSKRTGKAITLTDLLEEVPLDSARFFFNMREPGSQIEFDLGLAVKTDAENPVYYVQYAHARICSILSALKQEGITFNPAMGFGNTQLLQTREERALIRQIAAFPTEIAGAARSYDPARITRYVVELATLFHKFYAACRVKGEQETLLQARLALCNATKVALANGLTMLKVDVPEKM
ncbi:arginine--tRNA ligase [Ruminococcaceae bacterium OttesenSCG-928-A16]|nr:arginine--tRNA ligase [Ruminococcaceae bacterium OttesenSCG-928-A16]